MDETRSRLANCFLAVFPELTSDTVTTATPTSVKGWDSIATLNLLTVIEQEFGVEIDFAELLETLSYGQIAGYLERRIGASPTRSQTQQPSF